MSSTAIEWATDVWNPVTGCTKVSPGCKHCYAEAVANRFWKGRKFTEVRCHPERLQQPRRWRKPRGPACLYRQEQFANEWDDSCDEEGCPECGDERWIEDDSDPINDGPDFPIIPCPLCNRHGTR